MTSHNQERSSTLDHTNTQDPVEPIINILEQNPFAASQSVFLFSQDQSSRISILRHTINLEIEREEFFQTHRETISSPFFNQLTILINRCNATMVQYPNLPKNLYNPEYKELFKYIKENTSALQHYDKESPESFYNPRLVEEFKSTFCQLDESDLIITNLQNLQYGNPKLYSILHTIFNF